MKRIFLIVIAMAVVVFGIVRFTNRNASPTETPKEAIAPIHVTTLSVQDGAGSSRDALYQASVESVQNTSVKAGASGTLTSLRVRVGDRVSAGQLLATIENPESGVDMTDASVRNAEIVQTEIKVNQLKKTYQEASRVYDQRHTHANELAKKLAKLNYESAQITLQSMIDGHNVKSPVAGVVTSVASDKNESVTMGQEIAVIGLPDNTKVLFSVSQSNLKDITVGAQVKLIADGSKESTQGTVARVAPGADAATGKFLIEVRPEVSQGTKLLSGTMVKVVVPTRAQAGKQSMFIPLEALLVGQNNNAVFVVSTKDNHAKKMEVEVIKIAGGVAEINTENIDAAESIITSNVHVLNDGEEVIIENVKK